MAKYKVQYGLRSITSPNFGEVPIDLNEAAREIDAGATAVEADNGWCWMRVTAA